jgi:hypothetical protein
MQAAANPTIELLSAPLRVSLGYAERLTRDIPPDLFAHMPARGMNHPAFCFGHLSLYPNQVLRMLGREADVVSRPGWEALFKAGVDCVEQDGRYPAKDEILEYYFERHHSLLAAMGEVEEALLARENPAEGRMKSMFPTLGGALNFYINNHHSVHLGQVSAWRRAAGLGPA